MKKSKIVIMDFATCEVHIFIYDKNIWGPSGEDFIITHYSEHGQTFKLENCQWMIVDMEENEDRLPIYIH